MKKRTRRLAAAALIALLPPTALLGAAVAVNPGDYKPEIVSALRKAAGRDVEIKGPLHISRSLWPSIEASDVSLANLPGGSRPDMAHIERIEARLSLLPLLRRRVEIERLVLEGPNILFELVKGQPNWTFLSTDDQASAASAPNLRLNIRETQIHNGMVTLRLPGRTHVVGIRSLDLHQEGKRDPLDLRAVLVYSDYQPFQLSISARPNGDGGGDVWTTPWATHVNFAAFDASLSSDGWGALGGAYDFQVNGRAPALEKLNALLPPLHLPPLHGFEVSTHLASGKNVGDLPVIGATQLRFAGADLHDRLPGLTLNGASVTLAKTGGEAVVAGGGAYAGGAFNVAGRVGIPARLEDRAALPVDLSFTSPGSDEAKLSVKGKLASVMGGFDGLDAAISLQLKSASQWRAMLPPDLPVPSGLTLEGRLGAPADLNTLDLRDFRLAAPGLDLTGSVAVQLANADLKGELHAAQLDLDRLLSHPAPAATTPAPTPAPTPAKPQTTSEGDHRRTLIPNTPLPWSVLRNKNWDLRTSVAALTLYGEVWRNLSAPLRLAKGRLQIDGGRMGAAEFSLSADASSTSPPVVFALHAPDIPLAPLMRIASLPGAASGAVRVETNLTARGESWHELAASLDGPFSTTTVNAEISNAALLELAAPALKALGVNAPPQGRTDIRCFGLIGAFHDGAGRFHTVALDTPYLELSGKGQINLRDETLAFKLAPLARISGSSVSVPVLVEGPFRTPAARLDASGLDKVGLLIDAWFGGDHPETCADAGLRKSSAPEGAAAEK